MYKKLSTCIFCLILLPSHVIRMGTTSRTHYTNLFCMNAYYRKICVHMSPHKLRKKMLVLKMFVIIVIVSLTCLFR